MNGTISYNTPSVYDGTTCESVPLIFKDGKIVQATGTPQDKIDAIFQADEGARCVGEFALGVNPYIERPPKDTLYDEKISGSLHFTPGDAYEDYSDTATGVPSTGTWSSSRPRSGVEGRSGSMGCSCGGMGCSCCRSLRG